MMISDDMMEIISGGAKTRESPIKGNFGQRCRVWGQGGGKTEWNLNLFTQKNSQSRPPSNVLSSMGSMGSESENTFIGPFFYFLFVHNIFNYTIISPTLYTGWSVTQKNSQSRPPSNVLSSILRVSTLSLGIFFIAVCLYTLLAA